MIKRKSHKSLSVFLWCLAIAWPLAFGRVNAQESKVIYIYDDLGRLMRVVNENNECATYDYDAASRITQVAQGSQAVSLGYDATGRRTALSYPNGTSTNYTYDSANRLTRILHQGPAAVIEDLTYTYDAAGNRISFGRSGPQAPLPQAVQAAYDAANQQILVNNATPNLTYDANGSLTSQTDTNGTTAYTWDARNRLIEITGPSLSASFVYDALGRRVNKTINGERTEYQYDGNDIIAEFTNAALAATYLRSRNIDEPFVRQSISSEYYHADALGSVLTLTDQSGGVQTTYAYEPFGNTILNNNGSTNPLQFTGRENDNMGLYYYRNRYYHPQLQRFTSEDPLYSPMYNTPKCRDNYSPSVSRYVELGHGIAPLMMLGFYSTSPAFTPNPQLLHLYTYADNRPAQKNDPLGLIATPQTPGCDAVGGKGIPGIDTPCGVACCNQHDRCFLQASSWCDQWSWLELVPEARILRPDCAFCNVQVVVCIVTQGSTLSTRGSKSGRPC